MTTARTARLAAPVTRPGQFSALPQMQWPISLALLALLDRLVPEPAAPGALGRISGHRNAQVGTQAKARAPVRAQVSA